MSVEQPLQASPRAASSLMPFGKVRDDDPDVREAFGLADLEERRVSLAADVDRLFPEDDVMSLGEAAHQMLRPLEHEVPPQVRKADQGWALRIRRRGLGIRLNWHPDAIQHFSFIPSDVRNLTDPTGVRRLRFRNPDAD